MSKDYLDLKDYFALRLRILYVFVSKDYMDLKDYFALCLYV